jgi:isopentenyl-diphosphate delta-isomerase
MKEKQVILVDKNDTPKGIMDKMEAHRKGELHRAFSIFIFNSKREMLLQKRAMNKYHSGGLWTNACCSHPQPRENMLEAAQKRLQEEMGFTCSLENAFHFIYKAELENGLTEHELDYVLIGHYNGEPKINTQEVADWKYMPVDEIQQSIKLHPEQFAAWFKIAFDRVLEHVKQPRKPLTP